MDSTRWRSFVSDTRPPNAVKPHDTPRMSSSPPAPHHLWSPAVTVAFGEKKSWVTSSGVQRMDMAMKMGDLDGFRMDLGQWYLEGCLSLPLTFNIYLGWRIQSYWHLSYEMKPSNWFHVMLVTWVFLLWLQVALVQNGPEWPNVALGTKTSGDTTIYAWLKRCAMKSDAAPKSEKLTSTSSIWNPHHQVTTTRYLCIFPESTWAPWKHQSVTRGCDPSAAVSPLPPQCCRMPRAW